MSGGLCPRCKCLGAKCLWSKYPGVHIWVRLCTVTEEVLRSGTVCGKERWRGMNTEHVGNLIAPDNKIFGGISEFLECTIAAAQDRSM